MITCAECGRVTDPTPRGGTPCPACGSPLGEEPPLEVDAEWAAQKAATQAAAAAAGKRPVSTFARASLGIALLTVIVVIAVMIMQRSPFARGTTAGGGVQLMITAPEATSVTIDGAPAGVTPVTINIKNGTQPILIEGGGKSVQVTPDRDRVVDLR